DINTAESLHTCLPALSSFTAVLGLVVSAVTPDAFKKTWAIPEFYRADYYARCTPSAAAAEVGAEATGNAAGPDDDDDAEDAAASEGGSLESPPLLLDDVRLADYFYNVVGAGAATAQAAQPPDLSRWRIGRNTLAAALHAVSSFLVRFLDVIAEGGSDDDAHSDGDKKDERDALRGVNTLLTHLAALMRPDGAAAVEDVATAAASGPAAPAPARSFSRADRRLLALLRRGGRSGGGGADWVAVLRDTCVK
ncbi:hypothetical protein HK405_001571, partial [Cladochytrium tenue]